jgi:carboxyl-terminal processing protease
MKRVRFLAALLFATLLALATGVLVIQGATTLVSDLVSPNQIKQDFLDAYNVAKANYAGQVDPTKVTTTAIRGMLDALDPHSNYLTPKEYADLRQEQDSEFYGIGVTINQRNGRVYVLSVVPGTPAARAGLRYGDAVVAVDGEPALDWTTQDVARHVRGEQDTPVEVTVERVGESKPLTFRIKRGPVPLPSIRTSFMISSDVGYIGLTGGFQETTTDELDEQIRKLKAQGMTALILDLRGNPGGLLDQAVSVSSRFLKPGEVVVSIRGRARERKYKAEGAAIEDMPLVILMNRNSASASEIVAGALQDHDRALIVGESSFGKGLVQTVIPILRGNGGAVTLSTARYYTPSGRLIQREYRGLSSYDYFSGMSNGKPSAASKTDGGRRVYSGGGIDPDVSVPIKTDQLRQRLFGAVFEFSRYLTNGQIAGLEEFRVQKQTEMLKDGDLRIELNDRLIEAFVKFTSTKPHPALKQSDIRANLDYVRQRLQEEIITARHGTDVGSRIALRYDDQARRALDSLPQAKQLVENLRNGKRTKF